MTLPNWISVGRILLIPVFMVALLSNLPNGDYVALGVFALAAGTDSLDGYLARSRKAVTVFGTFLDPLADKLLISAALISLVELDRLEAWVAMVIIAREFMVTGLRMVAAGQNVVIPASGWGKLKTLTQVVAIMALITDGSSARIATRALVAAAVAVTVFSGIDYFVRARNVLRTAS